MKPQVRSPHIRRPLAALLAATFLMVGLPASQAQVPAEEGPTVSLRLQDCLTGALRQNFAIRVSEYNVQVRQLSEVVAESNFDSILSSSYTEFEQVSENVDPFSGPPETSIRGRQLSSTWIDPTIWGGTFQVQFQANDTSANFFLLDPTYETALNLRYEQSLLRNFGLDVNQAPIEITQNNTKVSESQFREIVMETMQASEFAYWNLVFARMDLEVKRQSLRLAGELLQMNRAKVEVGTMAPIDVTQAEAGVASREEAVIVAEAAVKNAEDVIRRLLNPPSDSPIWTSTLLPADSPTFEVVSPDLASARSVAAQRRPELEQQRYAIESLKLEERITQKATNWDLKAVAAYNLEGLAGQSEFLGFDEPFTNALSDLDRTKFADWSLGLQLDIPLGNRAAKAQHTATTLRLQLEEVQLLNLVQAADIDVRAKVRDVVTNVKRVEAARKNRDLQQKNVEAEQKKFDNGMSTSFTVLQIQEDLATAERQENLAIIDYNKSLVSLERAKGTLLEARQVQFEPPARVEN